MEKSENAEWIENLRNGEMDRAGYVTGDFESW